MEELLLALLGSVSLEPGSPFSLLSGNKIPPRERRTHAISVDGKSDIENAETTAARLDSVVSKGHPSRWQYSLWQKPHAAAKTTIVRDVVTPVWLLCFPIVAWACTVMGGAANTLLVMNQTESANFAAPPYNFNPGQVGYVNFAFAVGGAIGLLTAGPLSDWVAARATRKNHGIREPEMRLPALIPFALIQFLGVIVCGVGYQQKWPWEAIVVIGYGCIGVQVISLPTIAVAYAIDSYKPVSGEILVIATVVKNTFGFGQSFWVGNVTLLQSVMVLFACSAAPCLLAIPMYVFGKQMRRWTRNSKVHKMEVEM